MSDDPAEQDALGRARSDGGGGIPRAGGCGPAIGPWSAGRYRDDASMDRVRKEVWEADLAELKASGTGYMPSALPGFYHICRYVRRSGRSHRHRQSIQRHPG